MLLLEALLLLLALHRVGIDRLVGVVEVGVKRDDVIVQRPGLCWPAVERVGVHS